MSDFGGKSLRPTYPNIGFDQEIMDILPEKHLFSHEFCFFLYDQIAEIVAAGVDENIFNHEFSLTPEEMNAFDDLSDENVMDWLEDNGHIDVVYDIYYKQICVALLTDMANFIYEALSCSQKGKLTVAYALLRKPFKENLLYLEWLLADPISILSKFDLGKIKELSINSAFSRDEKVEIISKAQLQTNSEGWLDPEFIHDLRFDKNYDDGLEPLFQKANHLVTTFRFLETEKQNFNFVFSDEGSIESQWDHFYTYLPILLFHTVEIVEGLIRTFAEREDQFDLTWIRTLIGFTFWAKSSDLEFDHSFMITTIRELMLCSPISCAACGV